MEMNNIDTIIFDFGGVLIDINYDLTSRAFQRLGFNNFDAFYTQATQSNLFDDFETGKISADDFISELANHLPKKTTHEEISDAWNAMLLNVPKVNVELIRHLAKDYQLFMLSNTNAIHIPVAIERWNVVAHAPLESCFSKVYLSHEIGCRKPETEAFNYVCDENNLDPARTLFIDDTIRHIKGAQDAGIQAIQLKTILDLPSLFN